MFLPVQPIDEIATEIETMDAFFNQHVLKTTRRGAIHADEAEAAVTVETANASAGVEGVNAVDAVEGVGTAVKVSTVVKKKKAVPPIVPVTLKTKALQKRSGVKDSGKDKDRKTQKLRKDASTRKTLT